MLLRATHSPNNIQSIHSPASALLFHGQSIAVLPICSRSIYTNNYRVRWGSHPPPRPPPCPSSLGPSFAACCLPESKVHLIRKRPTDTPYTRDSRLQKPYAIEFLAKGSEYFLLYVLLNMAALTKQYVKDINLMKRKLTLFASNAMGTLWVCVCMCECVDFGLWGYFSYRRRCLTVMAAQLDLFDDTNLLGVHTSYIKCVRTHACPSRIYLGHISNGLRS